MTSRLQSNIARGDTLCLEEMEHSPEAFIKPHYAEYELAELVDEWLAELEARPLSHNTVDMYRKSLLSFRKSLAVNDKPVTLASLTAANVARWKNDMRHGKIPTSASNFPARPYSEATIHSYVVVLKVFSGGWIRRRFSHSDLLDLVDIGKFKHQAKQGLTARERSELLAALDGSTFEAVRDRAFLQMLLATALRFAEIHSMRLDRLELDRRRMWVVVKGGLTEPVDIAPQAVRDLKLYLSRRRVLVDPGELSVWVTDSGNPISYAGMHWRFYQLYQHTGIRCNPHRFRHTVAQEAARNKAPVADIQDLLHHKSDRVSRMYIGDARKEVAAELATRYSLAV